MKTLPKYWAVKTDTSHPLWEKFKEWLILEMKKEDDYDNWDEDDIEMWKYNWYSPSWINAWNNLPFSNSTITLEEWDSIVNPTTYYQVKIKQIKKPNLSYETQYLRSDWILFTKDTIDWKNIEDLKQEMNNHISEANKIRGLLKAHKNKF